jgi:hypothetical protein
VTCEPNSRQLTDEQKGQICGILSVGCDRHTAANFVGCSLADIRRAMQQDATFAADVCRAEAGAELHHMRTVQQATKEEKNWRASVWWLERRSPERFGPRGPGVVTARQLKAFIEILADALREDVRNSDDRQQVIKRLKSLADSVDRTLRDAQMNLGDSSIVVAPSSSDSPTEDHAEPDEAGL